MSFKIVLYSSHHILQATLLSDDVPSPMNHCLVLRNYDVLRDAIKPRK